MNNFFENLAMKNHSKSALFMAGKVLILLAVVASLTMTTGNASAKSLYVLSDINGYPQPLQVYDIAAGGKLTFQEQYTIPRYNMGSVGIAMDSDSGYLFVTYVYWNYIVLIDSKTMVPVKQMTQAPGAQDLAGIVYDHKKHRLYCVDRGRSRLWVYDWDAETVSLTLVSGAPFLLQSASAYGIALDEIDELLYVANGTNRVTVYNTNDWSRTRTISLNHPVVSVAVDVKNGYLYAGGSYVGNPYLTQFHVASGTQLETLVEPSANAGVMGIAVDPNSGNVYVTTGNDSKPGGDNIRVYDKVLHPVYVVNNVGNPTGLVIPGREIGYNPLGLKKSVVKVVNSDGSKNNSVDAGDIVTYRICFSNLENDYTVTDVDIIDHLPNEVTFVSASDDGVFGEYDDASHTYSWLYPALVTGSTACLDITVKINDNIPPRTTIVNSVTINSNTTPQTTTNAEIVTASNPLNIRKTVFGAVEGQTKWVDVNEVITYQIYLDNNDNNFPATDVFVTDSLPDDVIFLKADEDVFGVYNEDLHTYTWSIPSLAAHETVKLGITVRLQPGVPDGTIITNDVTVQSVETAASSASVDIRVGEGPLPVKSVDVIPDTVRRDSALAGIMVIVELPPGYKDIDVTNMPLILSSSDDLDAISVVANKDQLVTYSAGKTYVIAVFDKKLVMDALEGYGPKNILVEGTLANGGQFAGYATINITRFAGN